MRAALLVLLAFSLNAADNTLSPAERQAGWALLFDGKSLDGWMWSVSTPAPQPSWAAKAGAIVSTPNQGQHCYLLTKRSFEDFELIFDWRIEAKGNSGIKYRVQGFGAKGRLSPTPADEPRIEPIGLEYQLTDDQANPDALSTPRHAAGAIYEYIVPNKRAPAQADLWHQSRIIARGLHIEHWLDGEKVVDTELDSPTAAESFAISKRGSKDMLRKQERRTSPIALQMHDGTIEFRNLKIRPLLGGG